MRKAIAIELNDKVLVFHRQSQIRTTLHFAAIP